ncbi:entericidin A/B family lipoprotein [Pokkaliibacter sp. CJK22405]
MKKVFALFMVMAFALGMAGCNTVAGAGKDIEAGGDAIHDSAQDNKSY